MYLLNPYKLILCLGFTMAMFCSTAGTNVMAFLGDNKVLQWIMNPVPPTNAFVAVLHPLIVGTSSGKDYSQLFSVLGTSIITADSIQAKRVTNITNSNSYTGSIEFTLNDIREEDSGDYRTKYTPPGQLSIIQRGTRLIVYIKPSKPSITEVSSPVAEKDMTLNCVSQSNSKPDDHGLQMKYKWYRNGVDLSSEGRYVISGSHVEVKNIQKTDTGTLFNCEAFETESLVSVVSVGYTVDVQYGPDSITISPSSGPFILKENDRLNEMTCTASCNPACTYVWGKDGSPVSSGRVFNAIDTIQRDQAGQYVCKVTNKHGIKELSITVGVQYVPDKPVLRINGNNPDVIESLPITLTCTTHSVPPSKLTIHGSNMTVLNMKDNTLTINFIIPHVNCLDTGLFYCSAENSIGNSKSNGVNVNILCKPRPDHRESQELDQVLGSGDTMHISGTLISNPQPTIYWSMRQTLSSVSRNLTNNKDNFVFNNYWNVPTITSRATKTTFQADDFGEYVMHAHNEYGNYAMIFIVTQKQSPDGPKLTSILCKADTSVEIEFQPKFDGGNAQRFSIGMKLETDAVFKEIGEKLQDNNETEMKLRGPTLEPGVFYVFRVTATNAYGTASSINQQYCFIEKNTQSMYQSGIAMLVIGLLALTATIILGILLHLRRKRSTNTNMESQHYQDVGQTNNSYENGSNIGLGENRNGDYEDLGHQAPATVYDKLNHGRNRKGQTEVQYANTMLNC